MLSLQNTNKCYNIIHGGNCMKKIIAIILLILWIPLQTYSADYRSYIFIGEEKRNADVYVCESSYIFVPDNLDAEKQIITKDMLSEAFKKVPLKPREGIQCLVLLDYETQWEKTIKDKYRKDFNLLASYYNNNIFFYQNNDCKKNIISYVDENGQFRIEVITINEYLEKYVYHESAHHYNIKNKISESNEWIKMVEKNEIKLYPKEISTYSEEFAESVDRYYLDPDF